MFFLGDEEALKSHRPKIRKSKKSTTNMAWVKSPTNIKLQQS